MLAGRSLFQKADLQGPGCVNPRLWDLEDSTLKFFSCCSLAEWGFNCVVKVPHKASVKLWQMHTVGKNQIIPRSKQGVYFSSNMFAMFYNNHRNIMWY